MSIEAEKVPIQGSPCVFEPEWAAIDPFRVASVPREVGAEGFDSARAVDHGLGQEIWAWTLRYKNGRTDRVQVLCWTLRPEFEALVDKGQ
ncbi:hypothetical protein HYE67_008057 [Fusarium culmorum]|uniref:Uncharacterized protein n=1 Tax=Fusarium culmorum TaxID=5516 RepID=A0A2T4H770_FUSCU|nr:hypothetical protein FCULG_00002731 [Fusarium culmorum]QPC65826.1 hypothetical protein HYE67_008057 [Fusarium culmorum]